MSNMIEAGAKPRRDFSDEASGVVPYIVTSGIALFALITAFWFVS